MPPISVLYVDDDPALLEIAKFFLERTGAFSVATASSAVIALEDLKTSSYDVVISDYEMPVMNGIHFLKLFREKYEDIPFILFTGKGREEIVIEALDNGADSYIQKGGDPTAQFHELQHKIKVNVEIRKAQKALLDSEKKYRQLFENAQEAVFIIQDEKFTFYNPRFSQILESHGYSLEYILSQPFYSVIHPEDRDQVRERFHKRTEYNENFPRCTIRIIRKNGEYSWWEVNALRTEWEGRPATLNFARDVTEQYQLREVADESKDRYREMVDSLPTGVLEMDDNLVLTYINTAGTQKFGYRIDEITTITALDLVIPEEREKIKNQYDRIRNGECLLSYETTALTKDKTTFSMKVYLSPIKKKKMLSGFRLVCTDISVYKKAKSDLFEANKKLKPVIPDYPARPP